MDVDYLLIFNMFLKFYVVLRNHNISEKQMSTIPTCTIVFGATPDDGRIAKTCCMIILDKFYNTSLCMINV
jgi:hypothetical protein